MLRTSLRVATVVICCVVLTSGAVSYGGALDGHILAYDNDLGPGPGGSWSGTAPFTNNGLSGTVDWAVFTAADFNTAFSGAGYTPTANQLVYAFELLSSGTVGATGLSLAIGGQPAGNGDDFSGGGVSGTAISSAFANNFIASYSFGSTLGGAWTDGMAYSSKNAPELTGPASIIDGGTGTLAASFVARPSATPIPEPSTCLLTCSGMLLLLVWRRGCRR
jgi:hypothetical protein